MAPAGLWIAFAVGATLAGCAPKRAPQTAPPSVSEPAPAGQPEREVRALLLLMADQRRFEPKALQVLLDSGPGIREALAVATGRIGDPGGRGILQGLLVDTEAPVRRAAAFALGELGVAEAKPALIRASVDDDPECGLLAVEALGKIQAPLAEVRRALTALEPLEADRRLAPSLFRFAGEGMVEAARALLASAEPGVRTGAAYALGRVAPPEAAEPLRALIADPLPRVRAMAARGLGEVGGLGDLALLEPLLADVDPSPRIQALRAGVKILGRTEAIAPVSWSDGILRLTADSEPGVRATAIESSTPWLDQGALRAAILSLAGKGEPRERELALLALARAGGEDAEALVRRTARAEERQLRARAAEAAGLLGSFDVVRDLATDAEPAVRVAALSALVEAAAADERSEPGEIAELAREFLSDPDAAVRTTALDALVERPELAAAEIQAALAATAADRMNDARLAAVRALAARGAAEATSPAEKGAVAEALRAAAGDRDYLVRREAAAGLRELGDAAIPAIGPIETGKSAATYAMVLSQTDRPRHVELATERGAVRARLDCPQAPLTCLSFLQLAAQGYFDGTTFHRVVPDFVVQGGDPRGDGWGGPGFAIRDEINRLRYERGALGMALSGPDTGGSQFFFTLTPQPHLDGGYTVFGAAVEGLEVLDQIRQGDKLLSIKEVLSNE
jgi:cyclophilin family peptidyl-prolyl cis-trans isomerase/HEAT repeat protein